MVETKLMAAGKYELAKAYIIYRYTRALVRVVEVDHALVVGLGDVLGQEDAAGQVPAHLPGDVVPLGGPAWPPTSTAASRWR